ncbi:MAG: hypothetical protein OIF58_11465, partial [Cohaesibacter sp.]|nr:hypothetical protein [Cohaesibacter sp.]
MEYGEELARVRQRSEAYLGHQNEEIAKLKHELLMADSEVQQNIQTRAHMIQTEREMANMNEMMNNEIAIQRNSIRHHESEVSLMQSSMKDRHAIFNSELMNLQSTIHSQRELQIQRAGFTEEEVMSFIQKKIDESNRRSESEIMQLNTMLQ